MFTFHALVIRNIKRQLTQTLRVSGGEGKTEEVAPKLETEKFG
jgi:hypothetical protein